MNRILQSGVPLCGALFSAILFCGAVSMPARAGEVGFIEHFSLEKDRGNALRLLVPGTEDHFYYTCLSLQHAERFKDVKPVVDQWVQRYGYTPRVREILNRQALLTYDSSPEETLRYLREQLGLNYGHERVVPGAKPNLPKALDPNNYSRKTMQEHALVHFSNLDGFEDAALTWLATESLDANRRRAFLARLQRPDVPNLAKLVADDLNHEHSGGFGSLNAHRILLKSQMDELLKLRTQLIHDGNFVYQYLTRLRPSDDFDWKNNPEELKSYLERLQKFVETLPPTFNSLKAHVLYHELQRERQQGKYNKAKVLAYVKIPRHMPYVNPKYLETAPDRNNPCDLNANFQPFTGLDPIGNDEPLVRDMLSQFFVEDADTKEFDPYVGDLYLRYLFAETKLLNGLGDAQRWTALLPPEMYQQLKDRVDIDFFPTNRNVYASGDAVGLDLWVKNAGKLIVKVFEINTAGYYRTRLNEVETSINLDGLVPNEEKVYSYEEGPLRRMKRHFEFAGLNKAGVYVIDFIGNGKSSRAVIHKGRLHFIAKNSMLGHVLTVYDENGKKLNDATVWMAGRDYSAEKDGTIRIPYSSQATTTQKIVLGHKGLSTLEQMVHWQETYELRAGLYVDREQLLTRNKATLVVRPGLYVAGQPTSVKVLEEVRVTLTSVDLDGIRATKEFSDVKLYEDRETEIDFQVPHRLSNITFTLQAKVQNLASGQKQGLAVTESYSVNQIDPTDKIEDLHLTRLGDKFYLEIFGRTGEERKDRPVQLQVKHEDFRHAPTFSLQTDDQGRIDLGSLTGVAQITATGPEGVSHTWRIPRDETTLPGVVHAAAGDTIELPYLGSLEKPDRSEVSLFEMRAGNFVSDQLAKTKIAGGMVQIDKLDAGDYELLFKSTGQRVWIRVVAGAKADGNVTGAYRSAQLARLAPLQIASIETTDSHLKVQLKNTTKLTRVHVLATRFLPSHGIFGQLAKVRDAELEARLRTKPKSLYLSGRSIGDEYQYILDRRLVKRYPGNMLERPGLLINPWAIRDTSTSIQEAQQGAEFDRLAREEPAPMAPAASMPMRGDMAAPPNDAAFPDYDFLAEGSLVVTNAVADEKGIVQIPREALGPFAVLRVVAVDPAATVMRWVWLPKEEAKFQDLRLARGLDPEKHYAQQKSISILNKDETLTVADITSSRVETFDTLAKVYRLLVTLTNDQNLVEFSFLANWPNLKPEEKKTLYSKYASHELSFFLFKKDPEFFNSVIKPYLANKKDKTFIDYWLLGEDLKEFSQVWKHGRLNVVETILLGRNLPGEGAFARRFVQDSFELLPPDRERKLRLFETAITTAAMNLGDDFSNQIEEARVKQLSVEFAPPGNAPMGNAGMLGAGGPAAGFGAGGGRFGGQVAGKPASRGTAVESDEKAKDMGRRMSRSRALSKAGGAKKEVEGFDKRDAEALYSESDMSFDADAPADGIVMERLAERNKLAQLYRKVDSTKEYAENNYHHLPIEQQVASLVSVNSFWRDYAKHEADQPFFSDNFADASRNFTEAMFALSVLDVPFAAGEHETTFDKATMKLKAGSPMVVIHEEIKPTDVKADTAVLVGQNFFRANDRYRMVEGEQADKFVTEEFLVHTVYGCQVVVTNPSSSRQKLDVLLQIPLGAIPLNNGKQTKSVPVDLQPFATATLEYFFYFPAPGKFAHFPVHVSKQGQLVASASAFIFNVVAEASKIDRESWEYVSQNGTEAEVLAYLEMNNVRRLDLDKIAFRMKDKPFYEKATALLGARHTYNNTLWSYSLLHNTVETARQYLQYQDAFLNQCGAWISSPLVDIDPVVRHSYQHFEYKPLVNARAHKLGPNRQILNDRFNQQYHQLLYVLSFRRSLDDTDNMAVLYYMLLQDRIEEAQDVFQKINPDRLSTRLQYDYCAAWLDLFNDEPKLARQVADKYANYPVDRWRNLFASVGQTLDEIEGKANYLVDKENRDQQQTNLAATAANFDVKVESGTVALNYQNLSSVQVNYYLMDIELLFSRNPFVQQQSGEFRSIRPNLSEMVSLDAANKGKSWPLPEALRNRNVLVELTAAGQTKSQAYYANSLTAHVVENYGQVQVNLDNGKPLPKTYVKVYARLNNGQVKFYKDGYTDLRGRFEYASLSTNELDNVDRFAILLMHDEHGATVKEAAPPKR